jgi:hypothetical protein
MNTEQESSSILRRFSSVAVCIVPRTSSGTCVVNGGWQFYLWRSTHGPHVSMTLEDYCSGPSAGWLGGRLHRSGLDLRRPKSFIPQKSCTGQVHHARRDPEMQCDWGAAPASELSSGQAWVVQTDMGASDTSILTPSETEWQKDLGAIWGVRLFQR